MLQPVLLARKQLADYASIVGRPLVEEILERAERLRGKRILHVSATAFGGGVSEILYTLVPLMVDVGLDCEWHVIYGREEFFNATKVMHNALQGNPQDLTEEQWDDLARVQRDQRARAVRGLGRVHRPRPPAGGAGLAGRRKGPPLGVALPHRPFDAQPGHPRAAAAASRALSSGRVPHAPVRAAGDERTIAHIVPPAIDPLAPKNMAFSPEDAVYICDQFGIDVDRPLLCQVSRFDPWKDPLGVIDAYRIVKEQLPDVQLALVGSMATDDPEGWDFFNATVAHADGDPDIHILNNLNNVGAIEVNAFQSHCDVVIQKSTREGFGLTVTEAIWKARPFIGGDVGGIPLQVSDGETGFLVSSVEECARAGARDPAGSGPRQAAGPGGQGVARRRFLMPRLLRDWLELFEESEPDGGNLRWFSSPTAARSPSARTARSGAAPAGWSPR